MDLNEIRDSVNKELGGRSSIMRLTEGEKVVSGLSSGSVILNMALSGNPLVGYSWGRIVEIYGPEQGGKTTLALHAVLEAQRLEQQSNKPVPCLYIDAEYALDPKYIKNIGIDLERLDVLQPDCGEEALTAVEKGVEFGYKLIVVDSVAALTPKSEIEGEIGDSHMGLHARLMSQACRKITGKLSRNQAVIIFINQIRMKLGLVFGNPETTPGGKALKFWSSYRLDVRSPRGGAEKKKIGQETTETGIKTKVKVLKNKMYPPHRSATFTIEYGVGIDRYRDAVDFLVGVGAFKDRKNASGKKSPMIKIPSKNKYYTSVGIMKLIRDDVDMQKDVLEIIRGFSNADNS